MIELKITGEKPDEFFANCLRILAPMVGPMVVKRPVTEPAAAPQPAEQSAESPQDVQHIPDEKVEIIPPTTEAAPKKRGRPAKAQPTDTTPPIPEGGDSVEDLFNDGEKADTAKTETKEWTFDEVRQRVRDVLKKGEELAKAAGTADKEVSGKATEYAKQLFGKFQIGKISDLKAEQYADFMAASTPYALGTVS